MAKKIEFQCPVCNMIFLIYQNEEVICDVCGYKPKYDEEKEKLRTARSKGTPLYNDSYLEKLEKEEEIMKKKSYISKAGEYRLFLEGKVKVIKSKHHRTAQRRRRKFSKYTKVGYNEETEETIFLLKSKIKIGASRRLGEYYYIWTGTNWKKRCWAVVEKLIGRKKKRGEILHHKDGIKSNDRPENLQLCIQHKYGTGNSHPKGFDTQHIRDINTLLKYIGESNKDTDFLLQYIEHLEKKRKEKR